MTSAIDHVRQALAERTGTQARDWFVVFKARYGMAEVFACVADASEKRTVVTQALTCATAIDPILVAGLTPLYGDINSATMALDAASIAERAQGAAAVVIQHTFGIIDATADAELVSCALAAGAIVVEDNAHGVARLSRDGAGSPLADVSIHSFGVEKVLPTKFGGAVWVNPDTTHAEFAQALRRRLEALPAPPLLLRWVAAQYRLQLAALRRLPAPLAEPLRRALTRAKLHEPAIAPIETAGGLPHRPATLPEGLARQAAAALAQLPAHESRRAAAVAAYLESLGDLCPAAAAHGQPLVRLPLLLPEGVDAEAVVTTLRAEGIGAGRWYRPLLFPGVDDPAAYGLDPADQALAVTRDVAARIVNLPTDVSPERATAIAVRLTKLIAPTG